LKVAKYTKEKQLLSIKAYLGGGGYDGLRSEILACLCDLLKV
jgi:hypothetical protein